MSLNDLILGDLMIANAKRKIAEDALDQIESLIKPGMTQAEVATALTVISLARYRSSLIQSAPKPVTMQ